MQGLLEIVHLSTVVPTLRFITLVLGLEGFTMYAVPEVTVHRPVPFVGVFAARNAESTHIFWSAPAFAVVGGGIAFTETVLEVLEQPLRVTTHW